MKWQHLTKTGQLLFQRNERPHQRLTEMGFSRRLNRIKTQDMRVMTQTTCRIEPHLHVDSRRSYNTASTQAVRLSDDLFKFYK